jgi:hypothetical protein
MRLDIFIGDIDKGADGCQDPNKGACHHRDLMGTACNPSVNDLRLAWPDSKQGARPRRRGRQCATSVAQNCQEHMRIILGLGDCKAEAQSPALLQRPQIGEQLEKLGRTDW